MFLYFSCQAGCLVFRKLTSTYFYNHLISVFYNWTKITIPDLLQSHILLSIQTFYHADILFNYIVINIIFTGKYESMISGDSFVAKYMVLHLLQYNLNDNNWRLFTKIVTILLNSNFKRANCEIFPFNICNGCDMPSFNFHSYWQLV